MPSISFELPREHVDRLVAAVCGLHSYDIAVLDTGETRGQFTKRVLKQYLKAQVRRWEQTEAQKAVIAALTDIEVT